MKINYCIPNTPRKAFWLSFFLCLLICSLILFVVSPLTGLSRDFGAGNDGYIQIARNLVAGNGYVFEKGGLPIFHRPPMYPLLLVPVALFPENIQPYVIVVSQSILVGFTGLLIFRIAKHLYNQKIALIALTLFLMNPWIYWNAKNPMTGILQAFLYVLFAYLSALELFKGLKYSQFVSAIFIGSSGAALTLTHGAMLPVVFLFLFAILVAAVKRKKRIFTAIFAGIMVISLIAPWTFRNWVVFHKFIPVAGGGGLGYFNGLVQWNIDPNSTQRKGETYIDASMRVAGIPGSEDKDAHWKGFKDINMEESMNKQVIPHLLKHPGIFIKKVIFNLIGFYFPMLLYHFMASKSFSIELTAITIFYLFLWFFAVTAIGSALKQRNLWMPAVLLLAAIILYAMWFVPFTVFIGHWLYTLGTIPFLCILSAAGITKIFNLQSSILNPS